MLGWPSRNFPAGFGTGALSSQNQYERSRNMEAWMLRGEKTPASEDIAGRTRRAVGRVLVCSRSPTPHLRVGDQARGYTVKGPVEETGDP